MITGNENLLRLTEISENMTAFFEQHGLGHYFQPENLAKIGKYTRLNSLLTSKSIDSTSFIAALNEWLGTDIDETENSLSNQEELHFSALLPCGLRNPFKSYFETVVESNNELFDSLHFLIEGNVNQELSYYPMLDSISDTDELPDIIMASDINNFFHRPFVDRFVSKGLFKAYTPYSFNSYLEKAGYSDPEEQYTMFTANMLVMAVDKGRLGDKSMPKSWSDLLSEDFRDEIIMRGEDDFFCNAVLLPFYKDKGFEAIETLALNIHSGLHPSQMVKLAGSQKPEARTVYIMPYFFAKRINNPQVEIVWPEDGAIASPVFLMIKEGVHEKHKILLDTLFNKVTNELLTDRYFPAIHPEVSNEIFPESVKWLGWDFLRSNDIGQLKDEIRDRFMKVWDTKNTSL